MPLISRRGGAAARGFGLFGRQRVLTTFTFPAGTSTWTAPGGVTSLVSAVGKGSDGVSDYTTGGGGPIWRVYFGNSGVNLSGGSAPPAPISYDTIYSNMMSVVNNINNATGIIAYNHTAFGFIRIAFDNKWSELIYPNVGYGGQIVAGSATYSWALPTSGALTWSAGYANQQFNADVSYTFYISGSSGSNTTGFALSFSGGGYSGGTGTPASNTTYNNVSVIPGTTYTIVNNGALTITYYV
jgi:hypothetical protein